MEGTGLGSFWQGPSFVPGTAIGSPAADDCCYASLQGAGAMGGGYFSSSSYFGDGQDSHMGGDSGSAAAVNGYFTSQPAHAVAAAFAPVSPELEPPLQPDTEDSVKASTASSASGGGGGGGGGKSSKERPLAAFLRSLYTLVSDSANGEWEDGHKQER